MGNAESTAVSNKRIAKNTLMLYMRMFLIMGITLYTSRVVLQMLGVEDFGIFNIVGGVVVLFTFINNAMVASTQRFLNFELGRNNIEEAKKVFSASLNIYFTIVIAFIILAETVGLWFLNEYINIPQSRVDAANWVYQATIVTTAFNFIRTPYNAAIIAYESMKFYAYISVFEGILKLGIVFLLILFADRLISYAWLYSLVSFLIMCAYVTFCYNKFEICRHYSFSFEKKRYVSLANFSGWSLFGSVANMCGQQGVNILLNIFFGVAVNAAMGIASQVCSAINMFVSNFQTAFNPQIIKSYAAGEKERFIALILNTSKYSYYLLFVIVLPCFICCDQILCIWLGAVPPHAVSFCRLLLIFSLIDALQGPLWVSAQANGKIRNYQLIMGGLILLNIPIIYIVFTFFDIAELALVIRIIINIVTSIARVVYLNKLYAFPILRYVKNVVHCAFLSIIIIVTSCFVYYLFLCWYQVFMTIAFSIVISIIVIYNYGLNYSERAFIKSLLISKLGK